MKRFVRSRWGLPNTSPAGPVSTTVPASRNTTSLAICEASLQIVRGHDHGRALAGKLGEHLDNLFGEFRIERRGRLVAQQHLWRRRQRPGNRHALLLATRQRRRPGVGLLRQPNLVEQCSGALTRLGERPFLHGDEPFHDVLDRCAVREKLEVLEHHAGLAAQALDVARRDLAARPEGEHVVADADRTRGRDLEQVDAAQQRALAAAGRTDQRSDRSLGDDDADILQHRLSPNRFSMLLELDHDRASRKPP